jgi:hypothetical protein
MLGVVSVLTCELSVTRGELCHHLIDRILGNGGALGESSGGRWLLLAHRVKIGKWKHRFSKQPPREE